MVKRGYVYYASVLRTTSIPTNTLLHILCISILICSYMFRRNRLLQGAYTNAVKTYSTKVVLQ